MIVNFMKHHSTGALTPEARAKQYARYKEGRTYDYVFIGTGNSALTCAALLANAGKRVCMLEAHDIPGGYAQSFTMGEYKFCAQVHYTWGCAPGKQIHEFLKKIGLDKKITFNLLDTDCYDRMVMPDGKKVKIPYGFDKLVDNVEAAYPGQRAPMEKFVRVMQNIRRESRILPERQIKWWEIITKGWQAPTLLKLWARGATLQDVFNDCGLSKEAQAVLIANDGDMFAPPNQLSIFSYTALFGGYNTGAYYPTKHFSYVIDTYAKFITDHPGCDIFYETPVTKITVNKEQGTVSGVECADGKVFTAGTYICNADPQHTANNLIGKEYFPTNYQKRLGYKYSPAGMMIYIGLKPGFDLRKYGLGNFNTWHLEQWDMNTMWKEQLEDHNYTKPWFFISTAALHTNVHGDTPEGCQNIEIATLASYDYFKKLQAKSYVEYNKEKMKLADRLLDLVEKYYVPDLRKHIAVKTIGTSTTNEDFITAPYGNAYGAHLIPKQIGLMRLKAATPFPNFFWCNATSGWAGFHGTCGTGMSLYMDLTGDRFYDASTSPTDDELVARIRKAIAEKKELININL